jgi:DNA-binding FadR family transcriptional regulator
VVNAAGKFGPLVGHAHVLPGAGQSGSELVRSRIALRVRLATLLPGDRLPDELGISEITVRRALEGMCQDGLLDRRRGRAGGTFIAPGWDAVVALLHNEEEAASLDAFHLLLECGLVAHSSGEVTAERLERLQALVTEMDLADDPTRLLELEARFHLDLAETLGGPGIREFAADLLGRLCLLQPVPEPAMVRAQNLCHAELLAELGRGATDPAVRAVKAHQRARLG